MSVTGWNQREIFMATKENPNHEYIFRDSRFNEVSSRKTGFYLMKLTKVDTELNKDGSLIIRAYINDQFIAKDFCFDFIKNNLKITFYQMYIREQETDYFGFEVLE